jgi:ubiquinol-cytochrome c reductase subunit 6
MGLSDFFSAAWDSIALPSPDAEEPVHGSPPQGGVSTSTPASGTDEQSGDEQDVNAKDAVDRSGEEKPVGHVPGTDKDERAAEEDEGQEEVEDEEEEEETVDPKDVLEEGECNLSLFAGCGK